MTSAITEADQENMWMNSHDSQARKNLNVNLPEIRYRSSSAMVPRLPLFQ